MSPDDVAPERSLEAGLFAPEGAFGAAPWPVLVVTAAAVVRRANPAGARLCAALPDALPTPLTQAVDAAVAGRPAQVTQLTLDAAPADANGDAPGDPAVGGGRRSFRMTALPWEPGASCLVLADETTLQQRQWDELHARAAGCCALVGMLRDGFAWESDTAGRLTYVSNPAQLGLDSAHPADADPTRWAADAAAARTVFQAEAPRQHVVLALADAEGTMRTFRADAAPVYDTAGQRCGARGMCRDITELTARETALQRVRHRENLLYAILRITRTESGPQAILDTAAQGVLPALDAEGAAVYRTTGEGPVLVAHAGTPVPAEAVDDALARLATGAESAATHDADADLLALATAHGGRRNGALCLWHASSLGGWRADDRTLAAELAAQIAVANTQLEREHAWRRLSETDSLTGLVNRRAFLAQLAEDLARPPTHGALLYVDLDNFKLVNDRRGHIAGDDVLKAVARLLCAHTRESDVAARLGGDEFALYLRNIGPETATRRAATLAQTARDALADESGDAAYPLGLSIGVATTDSHGRESATELLDRADAAMYRAKRAGKGEAVPADPPG